MRQLFAYESYGGYLLRNPGLGLRFYSPEVHKLVQDC